MNLTYILKKIIKRLIIRSLQNLSLETLSKLDNWNFSMRIHIQEATRKKYVIKNNAQIAPEIYSYDKIRILEKSILDKKASWHGLSLLKRDICNIPGMLTENEKQYYLYITQFYSGIGCFVELGPWLGLSTYYLVNGLTLNPNFKNQKIHCFDDFIWRSSWMNKWLKETKILCPSNHESFKSLFIEQMTSHGIIDNLEVYQSKFSDYDGNENLSYPVWSHQDSIEIIVVDCGRTLSANEGWWKVFSPSFIKNRTLVIMQDWQQHKQVPELFYNQTKIFTDSKLDHLELIHEVDEAGIATFLYRG
jgi:hypothetical protein